MRTQNPPPFKACRFDSDLGTLILQDRLCCYLGCRVCLTKSCGLYWRSKLCRSSFCAASMISWMRSSTLGDMAKQSAGSSDIV